MKQTKETIDSVSVTRATDRARYYAEATIKCAMGFFRDDLKADRLKKSECKTCDLLMRPRRMFDTKRANHPGIDIPDERTES